MKLNRAQAFGITIGSALAMIGAGFIFAGDADAFDPSMGTRAAKLKAKTDAFCKAVKEVNNQGFSMKPGSSLAKLTVSETDGLTTYQYNTVWGIAEQSTNPRCLGIW